MGRMAGRWVRGWAVVALLVVAGRPVSGQEAGAEPPVVLDAAQARALRATMEEQLVTELTTRWYPAMVDRERGGFRQNAARDWSAGAEPTASAVYQSRLTWTAAAYAAVDLGRQEEFLGYARHGLAYLDTAMRDAEHGGFFWEVARERPGQAIDPRPGAPTKHLYGMSFVIYAAATLRAVGGDEAALRVARDAFDWMEAHGHDAANGGYFETFASDGSVIRADMERPVSERVDVLGAYYGYKSMNAHIHMLEAVTALAKVDERPVVRERLRELLEVVRDRIAVEPGALGLYFTPDWRAVPGHDSYGHDVETTYLMMEAAEVLGEGHDARTLAVARSLVDHALELGWDGEHGGFYDKGESFSPAYDTKKVWWTQAEGLNTLLLMHRMYGEETDRYGRAFLAQWDFIEKHLVDPEHGGWFEETTREGLMRGRGTKAHAWKTNYHHGRALMNVAGMLSAIAAER